MSSLERYNFFLSDGIYSFISDNNYQYDVSFLKSLGSILFSDDENYGFLSDYILEISISSKPNNPPLDNKVFHTVCDILDKFFAKEDNKDKAVIYTCATEDGKQAVRHRKFRMWFNNADRQNVERFDIHYNYLDEDNYHSIIFLKTNPYKNILKKKMNDLTAELQNK